MYKKETKKGLLMLVQTTWCSQSMDWSQSSSLGRHPMWQRRFHPAAHRRSLTSSRYAARWPSALRTPDWDHARHTGSHTALVRAQRQPWYIARPCATDSISMKRRRRHSRWRSRELTSVAGSHRKWSRFHRRELSRRQGQALRKVKISYTRFCATLTFWRILLEPNNSTLLALATF